MRAFQLFKALFKKRKSASPNRFNFWGPNNVRFRLNYVLTLSILRFNRQWKMILQITVHRVMKYEKKERNDFYKHHIK